MRPQRVVPLRESILALEPQEFEFRFGYLDALLVLLGVKIRSDLETGRSPSRGDVVEAGLVAVEGTPPPVLADFAKQSILDWIVR